MTATRKITSKSAIGLPRSLSQAGKSENPGRDLFRDTDLEISRIFIKLFFILLLLGLLVTQARGQTTISKFIVASSDDAEQEGANGTYQGIGAIYLTGIYLELCTDLQSPGLGDEIVGLRFTTLAVPKNAVIQNAYIRFRAIEPDPSNSNSGPTSLTIQGQAADNPTTFIGSSSPTYNISNRPKTTASVSWVPTAWTVDQYYNTSDLTSIVQEIVNRPGWVSNNSMVFIISGTGSRSAQSYDDAGNEPPQLFITFQASTLSTVATNVSCVGGNNGSIDLTVTGGTGPFTYDWSNDGPESPDNDPQDISGLTAGTYYVTVTDGLGATQSTSVVITEPSISTQPLTTQTLCVGGTPTVLSTALLGGGTVSYQWYVNSSNSNSGGTLISGATNSTYTPSTASAGTSYYYCVLTKSGCSPVTSNTAAVIVVADISVTSQPANATICYGGSYNPQITATGGIGTLTYRWQYSADGSSWANTINGTPANSVYTNATSATAFSVAGSIAVGTYYYRCVVSSTGNGCGSVASNAGILTIVADPTITVQPASNTTCVGGSYSPTVTATGGTPSLTYQWQFSSTGSTGWANVTNGTPTNAVYSNPTSANTFSVTGNIPIGTYYYRVIVSASGSGCGPATSTNAVLTVAALTFATQPTVTQSICLGGTPGTLSASLSGSGSDTYQWYSNTSNSNSGGTPISGATSSTYVPPGSTIGILYYYCSITRAGCAAVFSNTAEVIVVGGMNMVTHPADATICTGGSYTPNVSATGGVSPLTFQWQYSANGSSGWANVADGTPGNAVYTNASSATTFAVTGAIASGSYYYRCVVSSAASGCASVNSNTGVLTIVADPTITVQPVSGTICVGGTYSPSVTATGGTPGLTYQWQFSTTGTTFANVANGIPTNAVYTNPTSSNTFSVSGNITTGTYYYRCVVSAAGSGCTPVNTTNAILTITPTPIVTTQPSSATICVGGTYAPVVAASATLTYTYQWQYSATGSSGWANVSDGTPTNAVYTNPNSANSFTATGDIPAGTHYFRCIITPTNSGCGPLTSNNGVLTIVADPTITLQPLNDTLCTGKYYLPIIAATGGTPSLIYQWQYSADGINGWANVVNGTPVSASYTNITSANSFKVSGNIADGDYYYRCMVSSVGSGCNTVFTNTGIMTITSAAQITLQPEGDTLCSGGTFNPQTATSAASPGFTWQYSANGTSGWANTSNGTPTGATYTFNTTATQFTVSGSIAPGNYYYRCKISSSGCDYAYTDPAVMTIIADPAITVQPASASICVGGTYSPTITVTGGYPSLTYQWQFSANGSTGWANIANGTPANSVYSGSTTPGSFSVTGNIAAGSYYYRCLVSATGIGCGTATSATGTLTVVNDPNITVQPVDGTICIGGTYSPTVTASGGTPTLSYQWQFSANGTSGWANVTDGTPANATYSNPTSSNTFSVTGNITTGSYYYRCVISASGSGCDPINSNTAILTIISDQTVTAQPANATICVGGTYAPTVSGSGGIGTLTYQWQYSANGSTGWANVSNGTPLNSVYSGATTAASFSVTGSIAAGTYYYRCIISSIGSGCDPVTSNNGMLTVTTDPAITSHPSNVTICSGGTYSPTIIATGGTPSLTYQWQYSANGTTGWLNVSNGTPANATYSNANSATLFTVSGNIPAGSYYYRCTVSAAGSGCDPVNTNAGTLTVVADPTITVQPSNGSICQGGSYGPSVTATGGTPSLTYQWQYSANGTTGWANVANGTPTNATYTNPTSANTFLITGSITTGTYYYRCIISSAGAGCDPVTSNTAILSIIDSDIDILSQPANASICVGGSYNPTISSTGGTPPITYQWQYSANGSTGWANVANGTPANASYANATSASAFTVSGNITAGTYYYRAVITSASSGCAVVNSNAGALTIVADPSISAHPANASICVGGTYSPTVTASGGTPSLTYAWQYSANGTTGWANVTNGTPTNASYTNAGSASSFSVSGNIPAGSYYYRCAVSASGSGCDAINSNTGTLTVVADPAITVQPVSATICTTQPYSPTITATGGSPSLTYQWQYSADGSSGWANVSNGTPTNASYSNPTSPTTFSVTGSIGAGTYYYRCLVSAAGSGCDQVISNNAVLTIIASPTITTQPVNGAICYGGTYNPTIAATGGSPTYQWQYSANGSTGWANVTNTQPAGSSYANGTSATLFTISGNIAVGTYYYRCIVSSTGCASATSNTITLTIVADPVITANPTGATMCSGGVYNPSVVVTGGTPSIDYQWQYSVSGANPWNSVVNGTPANAVYSGANTGNSFTVSGNLAAGNYYYRANISATGSGCATVNSNDATLVIVEDPAVTVHPINATECPGGTYAPTITATGGTPSKTYQWQYSADGVSNWVNVSNGTPTNAVYTNATSATTFTVSGSIASGTYYYRCAVSAAGTGCDVAYSNAGAFTIVSSPLITQQPLGDTIICIGGEYKPVLIALGGTPTYQWEYSANGTSGWANVSNGSPPASSYNNPTSATTFKVSGNIAAGQYYYRCKISSTNCTNTYTNVVTLYVLPDPSITQQPVGATICVGGTFNPTIAISGGTPAIGFQWQYNHVNVVNGTPANAVYTNPNSATGFVVSGNIAPGTYDFRCIVTGGSSGCNNRTSQDADLIVVADPAVTVHPVAGTICEGGTYSPTITATGGTPVKTYQWQYSADGTTGWANVANGTPTNASYSGATTNNTFVVSGNIPAGTYYYRCAVSATGEGCNTAYSNNGVMTVVVDPYVATQPVSATVCPNQTYSPSVIAAGGTPSYTYQWQYSANGSTGWAACANGTPSSSSYANKTTATMTISGNIAPGTYYYRCLISAGGSGCDPVYSETAIMTVVSAPTITSQPSGATICVGGSFNPTISALAGTPTYQWQYSANGSSGWANVANGTPANSTYANATSPTLFTVSGNIAAGNYFYRCVVSSTGCVASNSNAATLTVVANHTISAQPANATICSNGAYSPTVTATGGTSLSYQWQYSSDGSTGWGNVTDGTPSGSIYTNATTANSFSVSGSIATGTYYYRCVVGSTGSGCSAVNSNNGVLTIVADPNVTAQPSNATICIGGTYAPSITAAGGTPSLTYQWQYSANGSSGWANVSNGTPSNSTYSNATTAGSFTVTGNIAVGTYYYRCAVSASGSGCDITYSNAGAVTVVADPAITAQPSNATICTGGIYSPTVTATGGTPSLNYQWQYSANGSSGWGNVSDGSPVNATYSGGTTAGSFSVTGNIAAGTYYYRCVVSSSGSDCNTATSTNGILTVVAQPVITVQPLTTQSVCQNGTTTNLSVTVTGGTGSLSYQWYSNTANSNMGGTSLGSSNGAQTTTYTPQSGTIGTLYYYCIISQTGSACGPLTSNTAEVIVVALPSITAHPSSITICSGFTYAPTVTATGGTPSLTYQWQYSANGTSGWNNVSNGTPTNAVYAGSTTANSFSVTGNISNGNYYYRCIVTASGSGCGSVTSNTGVLTIFDDPFITSQPSNATICIGGSYNPTVVASGGTISLVYQWEYSANGTTGWNNVADGTPANATYTGNTTSNAFTVSGNITAGTYYYRCVISESGNGCDPITSNSGVLTIVADPSISVQPANASICVGGTYTPSITASGGTPSLTYQWQYSTDGSTGWTNAANGIPANAVYSGINTSNAFNVSGNIAAGTHYYRCVVTSAGNGCNTINSSNGILTIYDQPTITTQPLVSQTLCYNATPTNLSLVAGGGNGSFSYQWYSNTTNSTMGGTSLGASNGAQTTTYTPPTNTAGSIYYYCIVSQTGTNCGPVISNTAAVIVTPILVFNIDLVDNVDCYQNSNGSISVHGTGGTSPYQYQLNSDDFEPVGDFTGLSGDVYTVTIKDVNNCLVSQDITISEPASSLSASITDTVDVACNGESDGSATVEGSGGTLPYTYLWTNGDTDAILDNVSADVYTVTVTDANNCTATADVPIVEPGAFTIEITQPVSWYMLSAPATTDDYSSFLNNLTTQGVAGSTYPDKQPNLIWFNESDTLTTNNSWKTIGSIAESIVPGRGYYFFVFGTVPGDPDYNVPLPQTLFTSNCDGFSGGFSYDNTTFPITFTDRAGGKVSGGPNDTVFIETNLADEGWNLLGNPSSHTLDWSAAGWTKTNVDNTIYIWDPLDNEFKVFNGVTGTHDGLISPFQSFWVRATAPNPVLSFTEDLLTTGGTFLRGGDTLNNCTVAMKLNHDNLSCNAFINIMEDGKDGPDKWDSYRIKPLSNTWLELFMTASEDQFVPLVINNLPLKGKPYYNFPLYLGGVKKDELIKGQFTLNWEVPDNWPDNWTISLHDHLNQKVINMQDKTDYSFYYQSENAVGTGETHEKGMMRLPKNIMESITDKSSLEVRGKVAPMSIVIEKAGSKDTLEYIAPTAKLLANFPNPFKNSTKLRFTLPQDENVTLSLFDINGRLIEILEENTSYIGGLHERTWTNKGLHPGIYLLKLQSDSGTDIIKLNIL